MTRSILTTLTLSTLLLAACSQQSSTPSTTAKPDTSKPAASFVNPHPAEIPLWNGTAPGSEGPGQDSPDIVNWRVEPADTFPVVTNINHPSITPYLPKRPKGHVAAVIIAPGGGHMFLSINHEGYDVAQYLADHGIAAFVLKYRLGRAPNSKYNILKEPIMDARRAVRLIRSRANDFNIDPALIGIMGFSAGGEVATQLIQQGEKPEESRDAIDGINSKPNFQALIYPGVSKNIVVDKNTPPAFLCCSYDDRPDIAEGVANVYLQFKKANVNAELHIYNKGGHGFGIRPEPIAENTWCLRFVEWMKDRGYTQ